jgi:hypothetical protein
MAARRESSLEVENDLTFQHRTWRIQRAGWVVFGIIVLAGLAGLFGGGPLSRAEAGSQASGLRVEYERFTRLQGSTELILHIDPRLARDGELAVVLSGAALLDLEISSTLPPPNGTGIGPEAVILRFETAAQPGERAIVLRAKPQRPGRVSFRVGVRDGPVHAVSLWVYP